LTLSEERPLSNSTGPGLVKLNVPASPAPQMAFWPVPIIGWLTIVVDPVVKVAGVVMPAFDTGSR
jgi:hypothetical protein